MWLMAIGEAVHSTAASHPAECVCVVCRAAAGDLKATAEIMLEAQLASLASPKERG